MLKDEIFPSHDVEFNYGYVDSRRQKKQMEFDVRRKGNFLVIIVTQHFVLCNDDDKKFSFPTYIKLTLDIYSFSCFGIRIQWRTTLQLLVVFVSTSTNYSLLVRFGELEEQKKRDQLKETIAIAHGITLIVVPYWWNGSLESVALAIHDARPDINLLSKFLLGERIPATMPGKKAHKRTIIILLLLLTHVEHYFPVTVVDLAKDLFWIAD